MKQKFVPYDIALNLKALGFNEPCFGFFTNNGNIRRYTNYDDDLNTFQSLQNNSITMGDDWCTAPLWQDVIDWCFEQLDFYYPSLTLTVYLDKSGDWTQTPDDGVDKLEISFDNQEEMILKAIETIKQNKKQKL